MIRRTRRKHGVAFSTVGADKGYDAGPFLDALERENVWQRRVAFALAFGMASRTSSMARLDSAVKWLHARNSG